MTRDFTTKTPAELAEARESSRIFAENRKRDREWMQLVARNAAQGIRLHPVDDSPWAEMRFSPCPPGCTKHGRGDAS